jgi:hypothetical protein
MGFFERHTQKWINRDNPNRGNGHRDTVEKGGRGSKREVKSDGENTWYDWVQPGWRDKELKPRYEEAIDRLKEITDAMGRD